MPWLLLFFLMPILEMYLLIEVAGYIDALPTIGLVMLTAVIGVALLRQQGLATLTRGLSRLQGGQLPAIEMAEGVLLAVAGALLITPGFVTDSIGFLFLFPPSRAAVARWLIQNVQVQARFTTSVHNRPHSHRADRRAQPVDDVIEGEVLSRNDSKNGRESD
ncbi:MAG: FxsA family protein [OM182 bacterium]|nr:MAG: FxsA family protein [OM182 bacterium]